MNNRYKYPKNWEQLRVLILIRDKFICQICSIHQSKLLSKKGKKVSLHIMHLDGNTFNNNYVLQGSIFNNPLNNLASGCPRCHSMYDNSKFVHKEYKKKHNYSIIDLSL